MSRPVRLWLFDHGGTLGLMPEVSNIRAAQRPGTKLVDIYHDLSDADGDLQLVQVTASADAGLTCHTVYKTGGVNIQNSSERHR